MTTFLTSIICILVIVVIVLLLALTIVVKPKRFKDPSWDRFYCGYDQSHNPNINDH